MIFVALGTQDKSFERLLKIIDENIENNVITEEVIVQAGYTKYKSDILQAESNNKMYIEIYNKKRRTGLPAAFSFFSYFFRNLPLSDKKQERQFCH